MKKTLLKGLLMGMAFSAVFAENEIPVGDYFIRNNATGMFLKAGHDWGVMAAMGKHGKRFTYEKVGDVYKLNTNLSRNMFSFIVWTKMHFQHSQWSLVVRVNSMKNSWVKHITETSHWMRC